MSTKIPCNRAISFTYNWASLSTFHVSWIGRKWANLVSQSTMTQMAFFLVAESSEPIMKSIEIESYFQERVYKGLSSPKGH